MLTEKRKQELIDLFTSGYPYYYGEEELTEKELPELETLLESLHVESLHAISKPEVLTLRMRGFITFFFLLGGARKANNVIREYYPIKEGEHYYGDPIWWTGKARFLPYFSVLADSSIRLRGIVHESYDHNNKIGTYVEVIKPVFSLPVKLADSEIKFGVPIFGWSNDYPSFPEEGKVVNYEFYRSRKRLNY